MRIFFCAVSSVLLALSGCQSSGGDDSEEVRKRLLSLKPAVDSIPASGLGPQDLLPGECGLFLWSHTDVTKFIFFSKALSGTASFAQGEVPLRLTQVTAGGRIFGQFNTETGYASEDGRQFGLSIVPGDLMDGGQRIESGLLTLTDTEGWRTKLPVLGVRACQPE